MRIQPFALLLGGLALVQLGGCNKVLPLMGYPPEAARTSAPAGITTAAVQVGAKAPSIEARDQNNRAFTLERTRTQKRAVVVFYRGHW